MMELFDTALATVSIAFYFMMMAALVAAPLALIALLVDLAAGRWMTARVRCWLWVLVAVRLVLPLAPESPVSAVRLWRLVSWQEEPSEGVVANAPMEVTRSSMEELLTDARTDILPELATAAGEWEQVWSEGVSLQETGSLAEVIANWGWEEAIIISLLSAWLIGMGWVLLRATVASLRFTLRLRSMPEVDDEQTLRIVLQACDGVGVRRPRVKEVAGLAAPALFGIWRPTLCLPEGSEERLDTNELRLVVLHEAMHLRRGDGYLAWLLTFVKAVHWFNPITWFTIRQIESYRELACDDGVQRFTQPEERRAYADLLLRYASGRPAASLGLLGLWFARPRLEKRGWPVVSKRWPPPRRTRGGCRAPCRWRLCC